MGSKDLFNCFLISVEAQLVNWVGIESKGDGARKAQHVLLSFMVTLFYLFQSN